MDLCPFIVYLNEIKYKMNICRNKKKIVKTKNLNIELVSLIENFKYIFRYFNKILIHFSKI